MTNRWCILLGGVVKGLLYTVQEAPPLFSDGGSIVLNASVAMTEGTAGLSVDGATKAAVRSFGRSWAAELSPRGVRVNVVSPSTIDTPILAVEGVPPEEAERLKAETAAGAPPGRLGTPDEVAKAVVFLASGDSSFIIGIETFVAGGPCQI